MSKTKIRLIISAVLIAAGCCVLTVSLAILDFDFSKLSTRNLTANTYNVSGNFDNISIDVFTTDVTFAPSKDENCKIECIEEENLKYSASVENGALKIDTIDTRKWYDYIGIFFGKKEMTVYLPKNKYLSLFIKTNTGDINIPNKFSFENLTLSGDTSSINCYADVSNYTEIETDTGNIKINSQNAGKLKLSSATGDIDITCPKVNNAIEIETDTGDITLTDINCDSVTAESDTGTVSLENVVAKLKFDFNTSTGNVNFKNSDADSISVNTSTGDVSGTLLSEKVFITETSTGDIDVPKSVTGGKAEISTSTGDIEITISQQNIIKSEPITIEPIALK